MNNINAKFHSALSTVDSVASDLVVCFKVIFSWVTLDPHSTTLSIV